jgi:hypothetical protein
MINSFSLFTFHFSLFTFHFSLFTFHFSLFTLKPATTSVKISIPPSCFNRHPFLKRQPDPSSPHCQLHFSYLIRPQHFTTATKQHLQNFSLITTNFKSHCLWFKNRRLHCTSFTSISGALLHYETSC